jgi:hypothetical protein
MRFNKTRKGETLLNPSQNQDTLRLKEDNGDTIVVRSRSLEPQEDSDEDTIVVQSYRPRADSGSQSAEPERIKSAGEATTEQQSRSGRQIRLPERYQVRQVTTDIATLTLYEDAVLG